jgi:hypothetical protein
MRIRNDENLEKFADAINEHVPDDERDFTVDLAYHLAAVLVCLRRLEDRGIITIFNKQRLIYRYLLFCWQDLIFLRNKQIGREKLLQDIIRTRVTLNPRTHNTTIIKEEKDKKKRLRKLGIRYRKNWRRHKRVSKKVIKT